MRRLREGALREAIGELEAEKEQLSKLHAEAVLRLAGAESRKMILREVVGRLGTRRAQISNLQAETTLLLADTEFREKTLQEVVRNLETEKERISKSRADAEERAEMHLQRAAEAEFQLQNARRWPVKNLKRHWRWRSSQFMLRFTTALPAEFAARMQRRMMKNTCEEASSANPHAFTKTSLTSPGAAFVDSSAKRASRAQFLLDWPLYFLQMSLAKHTWFFSEHHLYKFHKSATKRAARLARHSPTFVQKPKSNGSVSKEGTSVSISPSPKETPTLQEEINGHPIGFRAEALANLQSLEERIADWTYAPPKLQIVSERDLQKALRTALVRSDGIGVLSLSHDNYRKVVGGLQLCLLVEESAFSKRGVAYIHLSPAQPLPALAPQTSMLDFKFEVTVDGVRLGHISAAALIESLAAESRQLHMALHSMLGHSPEITAELHRACVKGEAYFWLHDYFSMCPEYTLMRNSIAFCHAPPALSPCCGICHVGDQRMVHQERLKPLFSEVPFTVVAPSNIARSLWQKGVDLPHSGVIVHEHCEIRTVEPLGSQVLPDPNAPLSVAYLGMPSVHKGWGVFTNVVRDNRNHGDFTFHHLGKSQSKFTDIEFTPVSISPGNWNAMSTAVRSRRIDVAMLCSLWPETYSFTAVEALSGGAFIVTLESSGNVAAIVRAHNCGVVFENETALRRAFMDGSLAREIRRRTGDRRPRFQAIHRNMTADLISVESHLPHVHSVLH